MIMQLKQTHWCGLIVMPFGATYSWSKFCIVWGFDASNFKLAVYVFLKNKNLALKRCGNLLREVPNLFIYRFIEE
jgi:hypothetical protein